MTGIRSEVRTLRRVLAACLGASLALLAEPATAGLGYALQPLAKTGDVAPGTGGGTFTTLGQPAVNASGEVVFAAAVTGGTATSGIFRIIGGTTTALVLQGDAAPDTASVFSSFGSSCLNDAGDLAFRADFALPAGSGVFLIDGGGGSGIAFEGAAAPGVAGGSFTGFQGIGLNENGDVAFLAAITGHAIVTEAVYVDAGGGPSLIVARGDTAPVTPSGLYDDLRVDTCTLTDSGAVVFGADLFGTTVPNGYFADDGPTDLAIAVVGGAAPTGGTYASTPGVPFANRNGVVGFGAFVSTGGGSEGLFVQKAGHDGLVVLEGDPLPGTSGGSFSGSLTAQLANDEGIAARVLVSGGSVAEAIFHFSPAATRQVAAVGGLATGVGGTFASLQGPATSDAGVVAFSAVLSGGPLDGGSVIYLAEPVEIVPAMGPTGGAALAAGILAIAAWAASRSGRGTRREQPPRSAR